MDSKDELKADGLQWHKELIVYMCWAVDISRVDILLEYAILSNDLALPNEGHLEQVFHIFGYLKRH